MEPVLLGDDQLAAHRPVPMGVDQAGNDRLAADVDGPGAGREVMLAVGPTAAMRSPSISMVPFSITSSPFMVTIRAPVSAMLPARLYLIGGNTKLATNGAAPSLPPAKAPDVPTLRP